MEQHPVPQQISSYEFRLVGDMTLKQFGLVAGGVVIALLFYASPLPGFLKWPAIFLSGFAGLAFAFLPFEERPLQTWIIAFLKAAYSPTQFLWQKSPRRPAFFEERPLGKAVAQLAPVAQPQPSSKKLESYLAIFSVDRVITEHEEQAFFEHIKNLFATLSLGQPKQTVYGAPPASRPIPGPVTKQEEPIPPQVRLEPRHLFIPKTPSPGEFGVRYTPPLPQTRWRGPTREAMMARFTAQIPLPSLPTTPNVLVGMVLDQENKMVDGAIIEIRDSQGNPVRAFKTNRLGQFRIVTPLPNDTYEIETEKENLKFDIIKVPLKGEIVEPIEIRAKGAAGVSPINQLTKND